MRVNFVPPCLHRTQCNLCAIVIITVSFPHTILGGRYTLITFPEKNRPSKALYAPPALTLKIYEFSPQTV